jgi:dienelactone hydrolase
VLSQDNTKVDKPIESIPITETNLYKYYLADPYRNSDFNTWVKRQQLIQSSRKDEKVTADKRSSRVKEQETKQGEAIHSQQERKKREAEANKVIWTGIGLGGLVLAQATPAAPYIDAAFATHGALGLAKQYDEGTLGLNLETGLHALEMLPLGIRGAGKIQPVVSDGYKAAKNWAKAKIITSNMKVSPYRFNGGYYTIGHDWDPGAFYHYERNILPKTLGGTRLHPLPSDLGESKIWLSKGKPWLEGDRTLYKIPVDKVKTQSSKIIDPRHAEYNVADEIDLLQDGVEILSPIYIPDKGGSLIIHGNKKFYVPTTKTTPKTVMFEPRITLKEAVNLTDNQWDDLFEQAFKNKDSNQMKLLR